MTVVQVNKNGSTIPTLALGTITVDTASTNAGGVIDFVGPATSTDGLNATPVAATASITVGSTNTVAGSGGILVDSASVVPFAVVGQPGNPNAVTDFAAVANGIVVGGSTVSGFYTPVTAISGTTVAGNADISNPGEVRISSSFGISTMRFNTPTGGLYNGFGNNMDQFIVKNGKALSVGAILMTPNVGANNVLLNDDASSPLSVQTEGGEENGQDFTVYQYDTQGAMIFNSGIRASGGHNGGYTQAGPGTVQINAYGATTITLPINLYGGLTILGEIAQGQALGLGSEVNLNGGTLVGDYTGSVDYNNTTPRPIFMGAEGGGLVATSGNTLTVDGQITGSGTLNIGYGSLLTNEVLPANVTTGLVTQNVSTTGSGTVILSNATSTFTGNINVNNGTLRLDTAGSISPTPEGPAGTGLINVNSGGTLAGSALSLPNSVIVNNGGSLTPGDPIANGPVVGTMGIESLTLKSGSTTNLAFGSGANSFIDVNGNLSIDSGAILDVYVSGTSNVFTLNNTYAIMDVTGTVSGLSNLSVGNGPGGPTHYAFTDNSGVIDMTITGGSTASVWNLPGGGVWALAGNWNPSGIPNAVGSSVTFGSSIVANSTVTLNANETVGSMNFANAFSYTISPTGGSTLTLQNNGTASALVTDTQGSHTINAPLDLASNTSVTVMNSGSTLTINGAITGSGGLSVNSGGAGEVLLTGNNNYSGPTSLNGGTLQVGTGSASGSLGISTAIIPNSGALIMDTSTNQSIGVSGTGSLAQLGTGTLALNGTNSASTVALTNGEIQLATGATITSTGDLTMGSSTKLDLNGNNATFGGLSGGGVIDNVNAPSAVNTLSFGGDNNSNTFSGVIQNSNGSTMSVIKSGNGTETLSSVNTFSGGLTINGGQVIIDQTNGVGSGAITDNSVQGILLGGGVTLSNAITDGSGSNEFEDVAAGDSATLSGTITVAGSGQFRAGTSNTTSTLNLTGTSTGTASQVYIFTRGNVVVSGTGSIASGDTASAFLIGRFSGTSTFNLTLNNTANVSSVDGMTLGVGNAADDDVNINVTLNGTSTMTAGGNFELNNDSTTTSGTGTNVTLNGTSSAGPTLTANSFTFSNNSGASGTALTVNGGTITAAQATCTFPPAP